MGEGYIQKFVRGVQNRLFAGLVSCAALSLAVYWGLAYFIGTSSLISLIAAGVSGLVFAFFLSRRLTNEITRPTAYLAQAILHISPSEHLVAAPNMEQLRFGNEMVATLARQVYAFATTGGTPETKVEKNISDGLLDQLPVPVLGLDINNKVVAINTKAAALSQLEQPNGLLLKNVLQLAISEDKEPFEEWLRNVREKTLTDQKLWQKVEVKTINGLTLGYYDIAASFNKHSSSGVEVVLVLFDHSDAYEREEDDISFVAMAVHELRSPVTIMRGYIEAFEDELGGSASPQIQDDLKKMKASAENFTSFVSNILNVARINHGQLSLQLGEENWNQILPQIVDSMRNRAAVYGKTIELRMQPGLPTVAADRITVGEVITNLIDNAIKYSPDKANKIMLVSRTDSEGLIETTVVDQGVGIPASVLPDLFNKFRRNHRNQGQIGGTGLGLFLCKAIVTAHHGNIWVNSKENQGSTFGFTLIPYEQLAKDKQVDNNEGIIRSSHGWIKNHTKQRR